jgi:hypothetical protein
MNEERNFRNQRGVIAGQNKRQCSTSCSSVKSRQSRGYHYNTPSGTGGWSGRKDKSTRKYIGREKGK